MPWSHAFIRIARVVDNESYRFSIRFIESPAIGGISGLALVLACKYEARPP